MENRNGAPQTGGFPSVEAASRHNKFTLWLLLLCCVGFVAMGILVAVTGHSPTHVLVGLGTAGFFALCAVPIGYMVRVKRAEQGYMDSSRKPAGEVNR